MRQCDSLCSSCNYCIEDDCLVDFEGAEDKYGNPATDVNSVDYCENYNAFED